MHEHEKNMYGKMKGIEYQMNENVWNFEWLNLNIRVGGVGDNIFDLDWQNTLKMVWYHDILSEFECLFV